MSNVKDSEQYTASPTQQNSEHFQNGHPQLGNPQPEDPQPGYPQSEHPKEKYDGYPPTQLEPQPGNPQSDYPKQEYPACPPPQYEPPLQSYEQSAKMPIGEIHPTVFKFNDQTIRKAFIRKVFAILMWQLLVTMCVISLFLFHKPTQRFISRNTWLFYTMISIQIAALFSMDFCTEERRKVPSNFIFLGIFTLVLSLFLGVATSLFEISEIMLAVGITAVVCFGVTMYAFQTKFDFTIIRGMLMCLVMALFVVGMMVLFIQSHVMTFVYSGLGAFLFSMYLVFDMQMMMGGKHRYAISPEDYVFAALTLYLDIIYIFFFLLSIIGISKNC